MTRELVIGSQSYRERLRASCSGAAAGVCVGIDPSPETCALIAGASDLSDRSARAEAIRTLGFAIIDGASRAGAAAVKPQMAWFEHAGPDGMMALRDVVDAARTAGLIVVLDGKRGDIPHSAAAYADAYLGDDAASGIRGDALTVNAWIGEDALRAMADIADQRHALVYALVATSNPGAAHLHDVIDHAGNAWWERTADMVSRCRAGAVVGATRASIAEQAAARMPHAPLLIPGIGAQGGRITDLSPMLHRPDAPTLVTASRSLLPRGCGSAAALSEHVVAATDAMRQDLTRALN